MLDANPGEFNKEDTLVLGHAHCGRRRCGDGGVAVVGSAIEDAVARAGTTTMGGGGFRQRLYS